LSMAFAFGTEIGEEIEELRCNSDKGGGRPIYLVAPCVRPEWARRLYRLP
jgi:hypothetical protein